MIGSRIKVLRESKGYNMRQMAAALNLPYTTYVNYEKDAREPNSEQLILISKYFGVSIDYLLGLVDESDGFDWSAKDLQVSTNVAEYPKYDSEVRVMNGYTTVTIEIPNDCDMYKLCEQFAKDNSDIEFLNTTEKVMKMALECGCFSHMRKNLDFFKWQAEDYREKKKAR